MIASRRRETCRTSQNRDSRRSQDITKASQELGRLKILRRMNGKQMIVKLRKQLER